MITEQPKTKLAQKHTKMSSPSTPLLPKDPKDISTPKPLSRTAARTAGLARVLFGTACVLIPSRTMGLFDFSVPAGAALLVGFSGVRDLVLGELLLLADRAGERAGVRRTLWGILAVEALDVGVAGVAVARGEMAWGGFAWLCGMAAGGIGLVGEALWGY